MIQTKRKELVRTDSRRPVSSSHAIIIGLGDGTTTRMLAKAPWRSLLTIRLPGEPMVEVPGHVFHCSNKRDVANIIDQRYTTHADILTIGQSEFFSQHCIACDESTRATFCAEFFRVIGDKALDFGDDIMDGIQGAWHIAKNNHLLLGPTVREMHLGNTPVIAIGAGPSLKRHIDKLRELQSKCLLICCDSLLDGLIDLGITPHIVTPVERIPEIAKAFSRTDYTTVFAGKPVVHHDAVKPFKRSWFVPCSDVLYGWALAEPEELASYGQSTGTMAVALGCNLTAGPVYLVGHDLSMTDKKSHWSGAKAATVHDQETFATDGYAGTVYTDWWWDMFRRHIESTAAWHKNVINVNAHDRIGAIIHNTKSGELPDASQLLDFKLPDDPPPNVMRRERFRARLRQLPEDIRLAKVKLSSMRLTEGDTDIAHLFGQSWPLFGYILRSLYGQFSLESSAGKPNAEVIDGVRDALLNVLNECDGIFKDMASCG